MNKRGQIWEFREGEVLLVLSPTTPSGWYSTLSLITGVYLRQSIHESHFAYYKMRGEAWRLR